MLLQRGLEVPSRRPVALLEVPSKTDYSRYHPKADITRDMHQKSDATPARTPITRVMEQQYDPGKGKDGADLDFPLDVEHKHDPTKGKRVRTPIFHENPSNNEYYTRRAAKKRSGGKSMKIDENHRKSIENH